MNTAAIASVVLMVAILIGATILDQRNNPLKRSAAFLRRRLLNWTVCGLLYASFYMARYNFSIINTEEVRTAFSVDKRTFGLVYIFGQWTYGCSQVAAGLVSDHMGGKKAMVFGAMGVGVTAAINGVLFHSEFYSFPLFVALNVLNNTMQPLGSLSTLKINSGWFFKKERGVFSGIFGCMISFGYYLALVIGGLMLGNFAWSWLFFVPAVLMFGFGALVGVIVKDMPTQAGYPITPEVASVTPRSVGVPSTSKERLKEVFVNPRIRIAGVAMFFVGWVRGSFLDWQASYYEEYVGVEAGSALFTVATSCISIGGVMGSLVGGVISDRCCGSKRAPVLLAYFVMELVGFALFLLVDNQYVQVANAGFVSFALFGTLTLLMASAPADFAGHALAGTASAVMNFGQYVGSGIASFASGYIIEAYGWRTWLASMLPCGLCGLVCMVVLMVMSKKIDAAVKPRASGRANGSGDANVDVELTESGGVRQAERVQ